MHDATTDLARIAEDLVAHLPPPVDGQRVERPWGVLRYSGRHGRDFCNVVQVRLSADDVDDALDEARAWFAELGQPEHAWWIGDSATPDDLEQRLARRGLVPDPEQPTAAAMVLDGPPPAAAAPDVEVRALRDADDLRLMLEIDAAVWTVTEHDREHLLDDLEGQWARVAAQPGRTTYLALLDGVPSAYGTLVMTPSGVGTLLGGSTLPEARGRGLYQALVLRRWQDAVAQGAPGLVVQASPMSRPVLERLGFVTTGTVRLWADLAPDHDTL
ncbi:MAG: hypothetical protein U0R68_11705 [Candidatus Nanopelagicales bacterium]